MLEHIDSLFDRVPELALFITIALGYTFGKLKIGNFVLGGIAGTLILAVLIGQLGIKLDPGVKSIFFALFIYAVGFQGGPQFFRSLNLQSLRQLISAFVMCLVGLGCVLAAAYIFGLDRGTAAGLAAGGLTQSAIIGTAGEAIQRLNISDDVKQTLEANVAVGYAICYIFGSLGPIIVATWFLPTVMRWDIRAEAKKLAASMSGGKPTPGPGQAEVIRSIDTRVFEISDAAVGKDVHAINATLQDAAVEAVIRDGQSTEVTPDITIQDGDLLVITGVIETLAAGSPMLGSNVPAPRGASLIEEHRDIIVTNKDLIDRTLKDLHEHLDDDTRRGVFLTSIKRLGRDLPLLPDVQLHRGDEIHVTGRPKDLDRVQPKIGYKITAAPVTDFIFFGIGMTVGILVGMITVRLGGVPISLGAGGGCLLSGLVFGWLRAVHPRFAALPTGASNFLRDFGLAVFVAAVGLTAGPKAWESIKEHGLLLLGLGVAVTIIPQIVVFYFSYYVLRIRNPIEALACVVGGRSANPGFAALLNKAGNATPVVTFTITYAVANVFLTLWGPVIIGLVTKNPSTP